MKKKVIWLIAFSIAMGYLETAVVIYLRKLYYPDGFQFPLVPIGQDIAVAEFFREAATIIMLAGIGVLSGRDKQERFCFFLISFAIWDIFYYVFLKIFLDWPESLLTWDILFLIPVPWVGPVIAPCIISALMIIFAALILWLRSRSMASYVSLKNKILLFGGCFICILSFVWDYMMYLSAGGDAKAAWTLSGDQALFEEIRNYVPQSYNWILFFISVGLISTAIFSIFRNNYKKINYERQAS
jgi:hypothetical protein